MAISAAVHDPLAPVALPPQRAGGNLLDGDPALLEALRREGAGAFEEAVRELGAVLAQPEWIERGFAANEHPPRVVRLDRDGERADAIDFHPAWHDLMGLAMDHGIGGGSWAQDAPGAHVARAAKFILHAQVEAGTTCPLAMTWSSVGALRLEPEVAAVWEPLVTSGVYEPGERPASAKRGALIGMALTERAGGSDVRASTTVAEPDGDAWRVTGGKWFVSAVQSDAFFVLAQTASGLSCLLVPRLDEDGRPNGFVLDRLKDKLGNRSNPTAEVELRGARGQLVGEEGCGVRTIMAMIGGTRQDCVLGSTAVMRLGTAEAVHWAAHRMAFGRPLLAAPAMRAVLADLALESEAATAGALRLARAHEAAARGDEAAERFRRLAAPVLKYWTCKRAPAHLGEALECQGGFGYVEESRLARAYREAPLMSVWEGSGSVQALDVLRALARTPDALDAVFDEIALAHGADARLDAAARALREEVPDESTARAWVGRMARCLQASLLVRHAPREVADAFCATRLQGAGSAAFGELPDWVDTAAIVARALPEEAA